MSYSGVLEEELKNKIAKDFFGAYDCTSILGKVDFCVRVPETDVHQARLFDLDQESILWAESKSGADSDISASFVQLILTIGKARTFDRHLPPKFLGAFDAKKIAFIPYSDVMEVFYQNDFNWKVAPSDHDTKEFKYVLSLVKDTLEAKSYLFNYEKDAADLRKFIARNFKLNEREISKLRITKNNFVSVYLKWLDKVKPTIDVNWTALKKAGILDADFYLADILSDKNKTVKDKLFVLLHENHYELDRKTDEFGLFSAKSAFFSDHQSAHAKFWNRYKRPPKKEFWDYIVEHRDLLVPQDVRERKGSFFTPGICVEKSQDYLEKALGENWQDEYDVWDCAAGTGNLLAGLTNKYKIWASTLDQADVDVMRDRIKNGANLLDSHVFQFDFLNDSFDKLPEGLRTIINDPERRKKLVFYINPPYAEAGNARQLSGHGVNKTGVAVNMATYEKYRSEIGIAGRELFAQFLIRIDKEIAGCVIGNFSKLKPLQGPNFNQFRKVFQPELLSLSLFPASIFDNVKGEFPIAFYVWNTGARKRFDRMDAIVHDKSAEPIGTKTIVSNDDRKTLTDWMIETRNRPNERIIGFNYSAANDVQHNNYNRIETTKEQLPSPRGTLVTTKNLLESCVYCAVRHSIEATWLNDRDQFLYPNDGWKADFAFQGDCIVFTLFHNNVQSKFGVNHWIPFTEAEVDAKDCFASHFMSDYLRDFRAGKIKVGADGGLLRHFVPRNDEGARHCGVSLARNDGGARHCEEPLARVDGGARHCEEPQATKQSTACKIEFSPEAQAVLNAGRELWRYYHAQPNAKANASFYDIRAHFQGRDEKGRMNASSADPTYTKLIADLRAAQQSLAARIAPKVYAYGFLMK